MTDTIQNSDAAVGGPPPAGPLDRKEQRRNDILEAAFVVFTSKGFAAAKIDDVAAEAQTAKGTVYLYFKSKEQLFEAMVKAKMLPMVEMLESLPREFEGPAPDLLRQQMRFVYSQLINSERREIIRLVVGEGPQFPAITEFYYKTILSRGIAAFRRTVQYGVERGEFRPPASSSQPMVLMGPAIMAGMWKLVFDPYHPLDLDEYCETHIEIALSALRAA